MYLREWGNYSDVNVGVWGGWGVKNLKALDILISVGGYFLYLAFFIFLCALWIKNQGLE